MKLLPWKLRFGRKLDVKALRDNDIPLLILDERWNGLFSSTQKTSAIERLEEKLRKLLKEEARLAAEKKDIDAQKRRHMNRIISLTPDVFEKSDEDARKIMQESEREINRINRQAAQIEKQLERLPGRLKQANLELLAVTVGTVYRKIKSGRKRIEKLEKLIEETREKLRACIDEKETLAKENADVYSCLHNLLGGERLEKLDGVFLNRNMNEMENSLNKEG
ncbi:MAG: hypothetical protein ACOX4M_02795 [Acetivibrionales bacterium]|jgi:hypothetical protein